MSNILISQKAMNLTNNLELLEGEITETIEQQMLELSQSVDDAAIFLERSEHIIAYFKSMRDQLSKKIKTIENASNFVESELKKAAASGTLQGNHYSFKLSKTKPKVVILDESKINDLYLRTKVSHEVDKTAIYDAIKSGVAVEGAELQDNFSLKKTINPKLVGE